MKNVCCSKPPRLMTRFERRYSETSARLLSFSWWEQYQYAASTSELQWIYLSRTSVFGKRNLLRRVRLLGILRKICCVQLNIALRCAKKPFNSKPSFLPPLQPAQTLWSRCSLLKKSQFFSFVFFLQKFLFIFKTPFFSESRSNPFQKLEVRFSHSHKLNIALPLFICWPPPPLTTALNCFVYAHLLHTPSFTHLTSSVTFFVSL